MPTPRALLLLICPLLLLSLAGPLVAAQAPAAPDIETSPLAADQEALRGTVAEQGRDLARLSGRVDGLQTSLGSAAKAGEAAAQHATLVSNVVGAIGVAIMALVALLAFAGYRRVQDILQDVERVRKEAEDCLADVRKCQLTVESIAKTTHMKLEDVGQDEQRIKQVRENMEDVASHVDRVRRQTDLSLELRTDLEPLLDVARASAQKAEEYLQRIEHFRDKAEQKARDLQTIQITAEVSQVQKQALDEVASRLDVVEALGLPLDPESYLARGNAHYTKGEYERSAQCYEKATQLRPEFHEAWSNWGLALADQGKTKDGGGADSLFQQAGEKYEVALGIKPDFANAYFNRACLRSLTGRPPDALADLKRAIDLDPKYRDMAKTDPDFESLRSDTDFRKLVGLEPDSDQSDPSA